MKQIAVISIENNSDFYKLCDNISVDRVNELTKLLLEKALKTIMLRIGDEDLKYSVISVETVPN